MIIATYYDIDGRRIGESDETSEEYKLLQQRTWFSTTPQVSAGEVFWANKGTQRRPANPATRWSEFFE